MKDLFSCDPANPLVDEQEKERLRDISEAFGLLLYHYKKRSNLAECIQEQPVGFHLYIVFTCIYTGRKYPFGPKAQCCPTTT